MTVDEALESTRVLATEVRLLRTALRNACTPPWPSWADPSPANVDALVEFWLRRAAEAEEVKDG